MILPIESWIAEKGYQKSVKKLFHESVVCYKNSAYRASLLFSYLGFLTIVKELIIKGKKPDSILEPRWEGILKSIENDDKWEKSIFTELINNGAPIFNFTDDIRDQIKYWKDRRNDCAHFKSNEIESHHVESFWSFLRSNVSKITIEGGLATLIKKFALHFDETYTPPNKNFDHLINELDISLLPSEHEDFFKELRAKLDGRSYWTTTESHKVFNRILEMGAERVQESLVEFLKNTPNDKDLRFLNDYPEKIIFLDYSSAEIRAMWKSRFAHDSINPFNILVSMFKNNLIPKEEIEEVNRDVFNRYNQTSRRFLPSRDQIDTLKAHGFIDMIYAIAFEEKNLDSFMYINSKCDLIMVFIENTDLNVKIVSKICEMADRHNYSRWLIREINGMIETITEFRDDFYRIADKNKIKIPTTIS